MSAPIPRVAPSFATLLALAWPTVVSRASQAIIGFCDAVMVKPYGEDAIAATTTGAMNSFNVFILPMGVVFIVQSFAAQLAGRGDLTGARRHGWYGLVLACVSALVVLAGLPAVAPVIASMDYTPAVGDLLGDYMVIRLLSCGAVVGTEAIANFYGGLGNTRLPMVVNFVAMGLNIAFNWIFIYGNLGAPELGVRGAAIASTLASWGAFAVIFVLFLRGPGGRGRLRATELTRMLRFGVPNGVNWFLEFAAFSIFINVIVVDLGTTALGALMAVVQVNSIAFMPAFGIASAGAILVGQAIGARHHDDVDAIVWRTATLTSMWMGMVALVYLAMPDRVMGLFESDEVPTAALVELGAGLLAVSTAWQLFDAIQMTLSETLRAAGDTVWCMWARIILAWAVFLPAAALVVWYRGGGPVAAVWCLVVYMAVLAAMLVWRYRTGAWRSIDLTGRDEPPVL